MEIILAFLLFFGGFTLGSNSIEKESDVSEITKIYDKGNDTEQVHPTIQEIYLNDARTCHVTHGLTYRDLTRPYHRESEQTAIESDDCEEEGTDE